MIFGIVLILIGIIGLIFVDDDLFCIPVIIGSVSLLLSVISLSISTSTVSETEAFFYNNSQMLQECVEKYGDNIVEISTSSGDNKYSTMMGYYTRQVVIYNENLRYYRKWQNHWILSDFLCKVDDDLNPIKVIDR